MARPAKPIALKILQGNPGKRKIAENVWMPEGLTSVPSPPAWLGEIGINMWHRLAGGLVAAGILSPLDIHNLEGFCQLYQRWREAEAEITRDGATIESHSRKIKHPACAVSNEALRQMTILGSQLGLSPSARARLQTSTPPKQGNFFSTEIGDL